MPRSSIYAATSPKLCPSDLDNTAPAVVFAVVAVHRFPDEPGDRVDVGRLDRVAPDRLEREPALVVRLDRGREAVGPQLLAGRLGELGLAEIPDELHLARDVELVVVRLQLLYHLQVVDHVALPWIGRKLIAYKRPSWIGGKGEAGSQAASRGQLRGFCRFRQVAGHPAGVVGQHPADIGAAE